MFHPYHMNRLILIFLISFIFMSGCQIARPIGQEINFNQLKDGVYEGRYYQRPNNVVVQVTITGSQITDIKLVKHFSSWIGSKVNKIIPQRIIENQSTQVDVVSGATNSSIVIMNAVQKAIEKAYK